jgi:hypothetical protein
VAVFFNVALACLEQRRLLGMVADHRVRFMGTIALFLMASQCLFSELLHDSYVWLFFLAWPWHALGSVDFWA